MEKPTPVQVTFLTKLGWWFQRGGGVRDFWCWVQICGQNFFPLPSALDLEFSQGGGGGGGGPWLFDAESKSVVKIFSLYQALWTWNFLRVGGVRTFWCWVQICSQNFFPLPSTLDLEFSQGGGGSVIFDAESKSVVKIFSLYQALWTLFFLRVGGGDPYFLMLSPNLWSKFFPFTKHSGLRIFSGWGGGSVIFDAESKSVVKNFSLYQALWTLFSQGGGGSVIFDAPWKKLEYGPPPPPWEKFWTSDLASLKKAGVQTPPPPPPLDIEISAQDWT